MGGGKNSIGRIFTRALDPLGLIYKENDPKTEAPKVEEPVPLPQAPSEADADVRMAAEDERRKRRAAAGSGATLLTGDLDMSSGLTTQKKTLLGG